MGDTIVLHNAKASDSAVYQCEASNRHGTLLSNANIMIMSKCHQPRSRFLSAVVVVVAVRRRGETHLTDA